MAYTPFKFPQRPTIQQTLSQTPGYFGQLNMPVPPAGPATQNQGMLPSATPNAMPRNQKAAIIMGALSDIFRGQDPTQNTILRQQQMVAMQERAKQQQAMQKLRSGQPFTQADMIDILGAKDYLTATMGANKGTAFQQDYQFLLDQGYTGQQAINLLKKGQTINVGNQGFNDIKTESYAENREFANSAQNSNISLDTLENLLDQGVQTGFGQETLTNMQRLGQQIMGDDYKASEIAGQEAFISLSTQMILPEVKKLGVNPTDKDLEFVVKGTPSLSKSIEGNRLMIAALKLSNARRIDEANFDTQFYGDPKNVNATIFQRDQAFQEHRRNNPQIYSAEPLKQAYADIMAKYSTDADVINVTSGAPTWANNP